MGGNNTPPPLPGAYITRHSFLKDAAQEGQWPETCWTAICSSFENIRGGFLVSWKQHSANSLWYSYTNHKPTTVQEAQSIQGQWPSSELHSVPWHLFTTSQGHGLAGQFGMLDAVTYTWWASKIWTEEERENNMHCLPSAVSVFVGHTSQTTGESLALRVKSPLCSSEF